MTRQRAFRLAREWSQGHVCSLRDGEAAEYHAMFAAMLEEAPPHEPLTIEELREMNGEPVYLIVDDGYEPLEMWALIDVPEEDHIVLINNIGGRSAYYSDDGLKQDHITVYRRPPEGEGNA